MLSSGGVTFVATSNKKALEARNVAEAQGGKGPTPLEDVMKSSQTFCRAFSPKSEDPLEMRRLSRAGSSNAQGSIIQSSKRDSDDVCYDAPCGLISAAVRAYNTHHELVLRPDDVWQAVLTQFSFYVQANAEELRGRLVDFEGKKQLVVKAGGTLFTADFGKMACRMVDEQIVQNIKDPSVTTWLLPAFSTTTPNDRIVASVGIMATLQAFFEYKFCLCCGLPGVTLLGAVDDWRLLRAKLDRLPEFDLEGKHLTAWREMLAPVFDQFVQSADGQPNLEFWDRICSHVGGGSGPSYLSGWITVFAVFTAKGEWQGDTKAVSTRGGKTENKWPIIDTQDLPVGSVSVPVLVDDNGTEYNTQMLAGQFGYNCVRDGKGLQPRSDWCIAVPVPEEASSRSLPAGFQQVSSSR